MVTEDLFPRSFIVSLDAPDNYFGPQRVFVEEQERFIRGIDDAEDVLPPTHPREHVIPQLPDSLVEAIRTQSWAGPSERAR